MSWIQTYSDRQFWPLDPNPSGFDLRDIAHSLSLLCRFNGHCRKFYSVAEHCVRVSEIVPPDDALWGLMHDAAEAYIGDLPRPVKAALPEFRAIEEGLLGRIAEAFDLSWPMPQSVADADDILLATEARDLMGAPPADWQLGASLLPERIVPLSPSEAEAAFLARYEHLRRG